MRVLVASDCATSAYVGGLMALFPDWEVRGVLTNLAEQWATPNSLHPEFVQYTRYCDLYLGFPAEGTRYGELLPEQARRVTIPPFSFLGLQPDCFNLAGFQSVLGKGGNLYSWIVVASFQAGLTATQTAALFNAKTYEAFDMLTRYDREKQELFARFQRYGIDLSGSLERWLGRGNFLYSYNHPRIDVFMEILRRALVASDLRPASDLDRTDDMGVADALEQSIRWPIYPEIAERHGLEGSLTWRRGRMADYRTLTLDQFIEASFEQLAFSPLPEIPGLSARVEQIRSLAA
jgi:hypothetical protein